MLVAFCLLLLPVAVVGIAPALQQLVKLLGVRAVGHVKSETQRLSARQGGFVNRQFVVDIDGQEYEFGAVHLAQAARPDNSSAETVQFSHFPLLTRWIGLSPHWTFFLDSRFRNGLAYYAFFFLLGTLPLLFIGVYAFTGRVLLFDLVRAMLRFLAN
jgi:hypothetical protein